MIVIGIIFVLYNIFKKRPYEYAINGIIYVSSDCYQTDDTICYCLVDGKYIQVDNYYIKW